jgi:DHA1 family multidrug resistance protein-like MFS transporter
MKPIKKTPLLSNTLIILLISMIAANIGGNMYGPLLPLYVQSLGANISQIGIFFTLSMIAPMLFQILGGWLSDAIGRVQAMAIGSIAGVIGYITFTVSPSWGWLLLGMTGLAMASSFVGPSFQALVAEQSTEETRGRVFGVTQTAFLLVGVIGAPLGGLIADKYSFRLMFIIATSLYVVATIIRLFMARKIRKEEKEDEKGKHAAPSFSGLKTSLITMVGLMIGGGIVTWIFLSDGVKDVSFSMVGNLFPLYMNNIAGLSMTELGLLQSISSLITMAFMFLGGILSDKVGERVGIVLGNFFVAGALYTMVNVRSFAMFGVAFILLGIGEALAGPAYNSLISKVVPNNLRGTAFGFFSTSLGIISLPAPFIGTVLWQKYNPKVPFYVPMAAVLLTLPVVWFKFKLPKSDQGSTQASSAGGALAVEAQPVIDSPAK